MIVVFPLDHDKPHWCWRHWQQQGKVWDIFNGLEDKCIQWRLAPKEVAAICNRFIVLRAHCSGQSVTANQITQLTKISYRNVNPWCKHTSDSCSRFKEITYCTFDTSVWSSSLMRRKWNRGGGSSHQQHSWKDRDKNAVKENKRGKVQENP